MPTTEEKNQLLKDRKAAGKGFACAEVLKVYWADDDIVYYAVSDFGSILPHRRINLDIEPRLLGQRFHSFEINGDLRTESVNFIFSNIDGTIGEKFNTYGGGSLCEIYYYYSDVDLLINVWWGSLQKPSEPNLKELHATATNGFSARENMLPARNHAPECGFIFGGEIDNLEDLESNGCKYNRHLGGSIGKLNGAVPFTFCPRTSESVCIARMPTDSRGRPIYYGGFSFDAASVITDTRSGYSAVSKGSGSLLKNSIRVIAGTKKVRILPQYLFRQQINASNPDRGFVRGVFEIGEGTIKRIYNIKPHTGTYVIGQEHIGVILGEAGSGRTGYAPDVQNYSNTAHADVTLGWVNAASVGAADYQIEADVEGYNKLKVYTNTSTYSRIFSDNRAFWILEFYANKNFGKGYSYSKFDIQSFIDAAAWGASNVTFTDVFGAQYHHKRTAFNAVVDSRNSDELITDICRSGRMSVPFQHDGKYTIAVLSEETDLENVPVFTDRGESRNILFEETTIGGQKVQQTTVRVSEIQDKDLPNEVVVSYEDAAKSHIERPATVDDRNQQYLVGRALGSNTFHEITTRFNGFGITSRNEAFKFAYSLLWFGEFDEGGIKNNCRVSFKTNLENILGLKKYQVIKIESDAIEGKGYKDLTDDSFYQFEYFRIIDFKKNENNEVALICQAYNAEAYDTFEVAYGGSVEPPVVTPPVFPPTCNPTITVEQNGGYVNIHVFPC
jgi:hypothetical protein